jgi:hypothetical protein
MRIATMAGVAVLLAASHGEVTAQSRVGLTGTWGTAPAATTPQQEPSTKEGTVGKGVTQLRVETQRMSLDESGSLTLDITNVGKGPPIRIRTTYVKRPDVTT